MRRCVIVGGANISDYETVRRYLRSDDFVVCCDSGLKHLDGLRREPDLVIGDFDSHENPELPVETIVLPHEKCDTDTMAAVREMTERGFEHFLLLGVFGKRLDHTLANVYILLWLANRGKQALAVDDYSEMEVIIPERPGSVSDSFPYFSLINIAGTAEGLYIRDALYPLDDVTPEAEYQFTVSNEPLQGKTARISLRKGALLLIRDR